jgi:RNA polymerase sigma-70 factor (ECF subfamily)
VADVSIEDLAVRAQRGDHASFEEIVTRLRGPLVAFLVRRVPVPEDADDVAQETLARAYKHLASYDPKRRFSTWLFAIGKHTASNFRIAQHRRERIEREIEREIEPEAVAVELPRVDDEIWQTARRILKPDAYRALWLRYGQDLNVSEVARELGKTTVGTKVLLFRARGKLLKETSS